MAATTCISSSDSSGNDEVSGYISRAMQRSLGGTSLVQSCSIKSSKLHKHQAHLDLAVAVISQQLADCAACQQCTIWHAWLVVTQDVTRPAVEQ
jgi:hypothetical protein